ncbi:MAG: 23S rRNA (uracil(1939)-C(5))-methyltransferase RlmD [Clostridiales bacterium]|nr:23S rRNA (uracil(1939)-C(5))-methyltransferase RlmD [Clostridiales bacterium]
MKDNKKRKSTQKNKKSDRKPTQNKKPAKRGNQTHKHKPIYKGIEINGKAEYLNDDGAGVVINDKDKITVMNLLPGEEAKLSLQKVGKFYDATIIERLTSSDDRITPKCSYFSVCGGCQLQHLSYNKQLKFKSGMVKKLLTNFADVDKIVGMDEPYYYRNKVISSFAWQNKKVQSGFYKQYSHDVVPITKCIVQDKVADPIVETVTRLCNEFKYKVYDQDKEFGFLRHVLVRTGFESKEVMVVLVVANKMFPGKNNFVKALTQAHPEITTIVQNINDKKTSIVLGDIEQVIYGKGTIQDTLCGLKFNLSPKSFYQINPVQTEKLYNIAMEMANLTDEDIVVDTYSGIGTISLLAAQKAKQVFGVEINKDAIRNSIKNARLNNIKNTQFIQGDAGEVMVQMAKEEMPVSTVFMDPPRAGSDETFLSSVVKLKPKQIIYISCNPQTQARDLSYITKKGYKVEKIVPVDMFPHTTHVECVSVLTRKV